MLRFPEAEGLKLAGSGSQYSKNVSLQTAEYPFNNIMDNQDAIEIHKEMIDDDGNISQTQIQPENAQPTHPSEGVVQSSSDIVEDNSLTSQSLKAQTTHPSRKISNRELLGLQSKNSPGLLESNIDSGRRARRPSYQKALFIYKDAFKSLKAELQEFDAQKYLDVDPDMLTHTDVRTRYRTLRLREYAFILASGGSRPDS